jgi:hypothetical protein
MRIQGVTGDLPAVAQLMSEGAPKVEEPTTNATAPAVAAAASAAGAGGDQTTSDRRQPPKPLTSFDPPLIAQRAVLGFPVGPMVAAHAREEHKSYGEVWAAVERAMPRSAEPGDSAA